CAPAVDSPPPVQQQQVPLPSLQLYNNTLYSFPMQQYSSSITAARCSFPVQLYSSSRPPPSCSSSRSLPRAVAAGGAVLVKFVADIAKKAELCPIGVVNWRNVNKQVQADIVELIRMKFLFILCLGEIHIPDGKIYNDAMLKHVGKHRRQWKFELKARYFNPTVRTRQQIENDNPGGIVRGTWLELVKYWYSGQSKKYADNGREARAMLSHLHTNGSTSFANQEMNLRWNMEESQDNSNQKPVGYGFGVKRSDVMGVHALLRKKGIAFEMNNDNNDL
ncbi:UvrABC system protein A, partial [Bienertia sinuspersici]